MQQHAHLARLCSGVALPLTLVAQGTRTTTAKAGSIPHAQAPIGFSAVFMREQCLVGRTEYPAIRLERKVLPRVPPGFPGTSNHGWLVALGRRLSRFGLAQCGSKLGGPHRLWL